MELRKLFYFIQIITISVLIQCTTPDSNTILIHNATVNDGIGLVLSPGFIDTHCHHDRDTLRTIDAAISQGITTIIVGQCGSSRLPMKEYYDSLVTFPLSVNIGSHVGHGTIRRMVMVSGIVVYSKQTPTKKYSGRILRRI